jgi:diacylglycerol kinase
LQTTLRGLRRGIRGQSNFFVYFFFAALALAGAVALDATLADWCLLVLCIAGALTAEMFRSALVAVARPWVEEDPRCGEGLEIAAGAVLIAVVTAATVAAAVFAHRFGALFGWWG